jgi:tRNA(Ile)-lysidine synthase
LLAKRPGVKLIVAHFNHGIRPDAHLDEELVAKQARQLKLPFEVGYGDLGAEASEESARGARYTFLEAVKVKHQAKTVVIAHHQDDMVETALLNVLRGTNRKGLSAISDNKKIWRPLLGVTKAEILKYAKNNKLRWREDKTNADTDYLRNYLRLRVLQRLTRKQREELVNNLDKVAKINKLIDKDIATLSHSIYLNEKINRLLFTNLPTEISSELLTYWLRTKQAGEFDKVTVNRLNLAVKTAQPNTEHSIKGRNYLMMGSDSARFVITP